MLKTNFITHNDDDLINIGGTSYKGTISANYIDLEDTFGEPLEGDDYKTDAEWVVSFTVGDATVVATIYNWKNGKNYCGDDGDDVLDIREWNVGGHDPMCVTLVEQAIREVTEC
jgi:hypothetical protein